MMRLRVAAHERLADGVAGLTLQGSAPLPAWRPGAHVDLRLGPDLVRQYSLCGDPADRTAWRLAVLRDGVASSYVHDRLTVGAEVEVEGPRNHFELVPSPRYLFLAGGIGITPIRPMVAAVPEGSWRLVYGGRGRASMAFADSLAALGDHVEIVEGLLDLPALLGEPLPDTAVYCCGPAPMLDAVQKYCADWPPGALHLERFTPAPVDTSADESFEVELAASGLTLRIPPGTSILETVEAAGVPVLSSCREGTCGTCETPVLDGVPDHRDSVLTEAERESADFMMICVSRSRTPRLVLDL
jgi:ferredoxin-NADP reductase